MDIDKLREERKKLVQAEENAYSPDNFPTSAAYREMMRRQQAIRDFDAAHPEIVATIKAEKEAAKEAARLEHERNMKDPRYCDKILGL